MNKRLEQISKLLVIFGVFCRIGPSTFGGGYAMIPVIEREIVKKRGWLQQSEMGELISIAGAAPGGVGVNSAAFIGYRLSGISGAVMAVLGITLPALAIVFALSLVYSQVHTLPKVVAALKGIHAGIIALILIAAYRMAQAALVDKTTLAIALGAAALLFATPIHPMMVILLGAAMGLLVGALKSVLGSAMQHEKASVKESKPELMFPEYYI